MFNVNFAKHVRQRFASDLRRAQKEIKREAKRKSKPMPKPHVETTEIKDITL